MALEGDCTTDHTISVPDGYTLDGQGYAITAVDPDSAYFAEPVLENADAGGVMNVTNLVVTADVAQNCGGELFGIHFQQASGSVSRTTVANITQDSGCQTGLGVVVDNRGDSDPESVDISQSVIESYGKGGIACLGDVDCTIEHNVIGQSVDQDQQGANSVQFSNGAGGSLRFNHIAGNQWLGSSAYAATAVLAYLSTDVLVANNNIGGNADVGIYVAGDNAATVDNNRVFERSPDGNVHGFDWGLLDVGSGNPMSNNKVRGYEYPAASSPDDGDISGTKVVAAPDSIPEADWCTSQSCY